LSSKRCHFIYRDLHNVEVYWILAFIRGRLSGIISAGLIVPAFRADGILISVVVEKFLRIIKDDENAVVFRSNNNVLDSGNLLRLLSNASLKKRAS